MGLGLRLEIDLNLQDGWKFFQPVIKHGRKEMPGGKTAKRLDAPGNLLRWTSSFNRIPEGPGCQDQKDRIQAEWINRRPARSVRTTGEKESSRRANLNDEWLNSDDEPSR